MSHRIGTLLVSEGLIVASGARTHAGVLRDLADHLEGLSPANGRRQVAGCREVLAGRAGAAAVGAATDDLVSQIRYVVGQSRCDLEFGPDAGDGTWGYSAAA